MQTDSFSIQILQINDYELDFANVQFVIMYSSVENIGLQMTINYKDEKDIKNELPIHGGETIQVKIVDRHTGIEFDKEFILYDIVEISKKNLKDNFIEIKAIEKEAFYLINSRVNRSWNDPTISSIVSELDSEAIVEPTSAPLVTKSIVIPGWPANKAIQYLTKFGVSAKYGAQYLYYQDIQDRHFISLGKLLDVQTAKNFVFQQANPKYKYNILDHKEITYIAGLDYAYNNLYDTKQVTYNPNLKAIESNEYSIDTMFEDNWTLGANKHYLDMSENIGQRLDSISHMSQDTLKNNIITQHNTFSLFSKRLEILINGTFDFKVGEVINIEMKRRYTKTDPHNELNGLYLVRKVATMFQRDGWTIKAEVVKNAAYDGEENISSNVVNVSLLS